LGHAIQKCHCRKDVDGDGCLFRNCEGSNELLIQVVENCRKTFAHLNSEEKCSRQTELLRGLLPQAHAYADGGRLNLNWQINGQKVCKGTFLFLYDISDHYYRQFSSSVKEARCGNVNAVPVRAFTDDYRAEYSWNEMEADVFEPNITDGQVDEDMVRAAGTARNDDTMVCSIWLKQYFEMCDQSPSKRCTFVNVSEKSEVYKLYELEMKKLNSSYLCKNSFLETWATLYPHCVRRPRCDILGKCATCYDIDRIRRCNEGRVIQEMCKQAHAIHRGGMFMRERLSYKARVYKSLVSLASGKPRIMSIIIDGMDQSTCAVPHLGSQDTFTKPLKQGITGVKEHGVGVTLYRTINTVKKGADLTIYCITKQLEKFYDRNKCYPDELYIQADGGAENANKYVLATLELLVAQRVVKKIVFSRLPTGHTHEDIDAIFGTISKWINAFDTHIPTLDAYKSLIETSFLSGAMKCKIEDVMLIPDYQAIMGPHIDPKFKHLHKVHDTQHQWQFEAVEPCPYFPLGCRTAYRAYCSDTVVEFVKKAKELCQSKIGRYIGLEPVTVRCQWYPSADCNPTRPGIEGFYILHGVPDFKLSEELPQYPISQSAPVKMRESRNEILKQYPEASEPESRRIWLDWFDIYMPASTSSVDYARQLRRKRSMYSVPLRHIIFCRRTAMNRELQTYDELNRLNDDSIDWPKVECFAMPSVATSFNENPPMPRLVRQVDAAWTESMNHFNDAMTDYYSTIFPASVTVDSLKHLLRNTLSYSCTIPPSSDTRLRLLNKVQQLNKDFVSIIQRSLIGADIQFIHYKMSSAKDDEELVKIGTMSITGAIYRNLLPAQQFSVEFMRAIMSLFRDRCSRISETYKEIHEVPPNPKDPVDTSLFFSSMAEAEAEMVPLLANESVVSVYVLCKDTSGAWYLFYIDLKNGILFILNPRYGTGAVSEADTAVYDRHADRLQVLMRLKYDRDFDLKSYPHQYYQLNEDDFSSGIYIFLLIYHLEMKCPIYFRRLDLEKTRNNLGYWMLIRQLPC